MEQQEEKQWVFPGARRTGRTTRMLRYVLEKALHRKKMIVVAAGSTNAFDLERAFLRLVAMHPDMQAVPIRKGILGVEFMTWAELQRKVGRWDWEKMSPDSKPGPGVTTEFLGQEVEYLIDHSIIEMNLQPALEELHRWDPAKE